ncbi:MAG: GNAT family N-acetyltransferase [Candidatus Hermodarchaeota archaeon]
MKVKFYDDINVFYDLASPFLLINEVENGLLLAILNSLKKNIQRYGKEKPILLTITKDNEIQLITIRTPPQDLLISYTDDLNTIEILIDELLKRKEILPGILSFNEAADKFKEMWCQKTSLKPQLLRKERIYSLNAVSEDTLGKNRFCVATKQYEKIVLKWTREMLKEALKEITEKELERTINNFKIEFENNNSQMYLLFDNGNPVSMARKAGKTPNGNAINMVYTPPSLRRKGYATECVAKLSKLLLEEGNKYCFLFTDLSNPTSNSIYQKIGYRPIIDENHYKFVSE